MTEGGWGPSCSPLRPPACFLMFHSLSLVEALVALTRAGMGRVPSPPWSGPPSPPLLTSVWGPSPSTLPAALHPSHRARFCSVRSPHVSPRP